MLRYRMHLVNEHFEASNEFEAIDDQSARREALESAFSIGAEEVAKGKPLFAAQITVEGPDQSVQRFIATVGASSLIN
jgi:hypothetical protein